MKLPLIPSDIQNQRALVRVDFNVPMDGVRIVDDFRILRTLPSIEGLQAQGAAVVLMAHLDTDGERPSLKPIADHCTAHIKNFRFIADVAGSEAKEAVRALSAGEVLMLENLRLDDGETANTSEFARRLASFGDFYVNEAFSASHRKHASIVGVPQYISAYAGPLFQTEVENLSRALNPPRPFLFVLGGKKISTKVPLVEKFLKKADTIVIGGAAAGALLKSRGFDAITTPTEELAVMEKFANAPTIITPLDVAVERGGKRLVVESAAIQAGDMIYDLGPETTALIAQYAKGSKFILWNGPVGYCEKGFVDGTKALAEAFANSGAQVVVGGGETVSFLREWGYLDRFSFVSTGGGAMLAFLVSETLPGIEALARRNPKS
ncbi:MAG: phosphoglycerate kinase [Candidatus Niyogibacteria bacterium]|nr:phosphoglycerate kinase [Candidatus Niyogibacteria bacterium]